MHHNHSIPTASVLPVVSIVDDDPCVRDAIKDLVGSLTVDVFAFESAEDFLRSPQATSTACLITDVQMPGMGGHELQLKLRAAGRLFPIIFITAFPETALRKRIQEAGALALLEKPFDGKTLIELLRTALERDGKSAS